MPADPPSFPCKFITGPAGTGKSTFLRRRVEKNPKYGILACTTGIAAVNLGGVTINSVLKYFNQADLLDAYRSRWLHHRLRRLSEIYENLLIDEISMMDLWQLQHIFNANSEIETPLGMVLTGDFCQLPPVNGHFAFWADCWRHFETIRLDYPHRQDDRTFLKALQFAREGKGSAAVAILKPIAAWSDRVDIDFAGTTIMSNNSDVDEHNSRRYSDLSGVERLYQSERWGKQDRTWEIIPYQLSLKDGACVMILANDPPQFKYANGDCGTIVHCHEGSVVVRLKRNSEEVVINYLTRNVESREKPADCYWHVGDRPEWRALRFPTGALDRRWHQVHATATSIRHNDSQEPRIDTRRCAVGYP